MKAIEIITPKDLSKSLKAYFKTRYGIEVNTRYIKTVRGLMDSWYELTPENGSEFPNEFRAEVISKFYPDAAVRNKDDICYGNVQNHRLAIYGKQWVRILQDMEGE